MTASALDFTTTASKGFKNHRSVILSQSIYQVEVSGEDGEYMTYDITASSYSEASAIAESLASQDMINIS